MKKFIIVFMAASLLALAGCLASVNSPDGISCNFSQGKALWQMPLACQGH